MSDTITRAHLAESIYRKVGLSRSESADLVEQVLDVISSALVDGDNVKVSSFGSFKIRNKRERIGRNPKTGEEYPISARRVLTFRASNRFKDKVNRGAKKQQAQAAAPSFNN